MPSFCPDQRFTQEQIDRLCDLMARWRKARDNDLALPDKMVAELESLVEEELAAATLRAKAG